MNSEMYPGAAALLLTLGSLAAYGKYRIGVRRQFEELRNSFDRERKMYEGRLTELREKLLVLERTTLEQTALVQTLKEAAHEVATESLRPGALRRSARAEALRLLRSGLSPDTAGGTLGMAKREIRLLDRVRRTICSR